MGNTGGKVKHATHTITHQVTKDDELVTGS